MRSFRDFKGDLFRVHDPALTVGDERLIEKLDKITVNTSEAST
jgi:hypothetical protein